MKTLFDDADRASLLQRLGALQADTARQWGKMDAAQMVTHCARALETGTGDRPMKQKLIGKILMPFFRKSILGGYRRQRDPILQSLDGFVVTLGDLAFDVGQVVGDSDIGEDEDGECDQNTLHGCLHTIRTFERRDAIACGFPRVFKRDRAREPQRLHYLISMNTLSFTAAA